MLFKDTYILICMGQDKQQFQGIVTSAFGERVLGQRGTHKRLYLFL